MKLMAVGIIILSLFIGSVYLGLFGHIYTKKDLKDFRNHSASLVLSDNGSIIGRYFFENRTNVKLEQMPKGLIEALVATEDARYFEHEGVDSRSLLRVLVKSIILQQKSAGGGSTITQQLAKNMFGRQNHGWISMPVNKTKEIFLAHRIEELYSKEEILVLYLNTVPFGENVFGIEAASRRYFNKSAAKLKTEESAVLIGMLKANTYYNPRLYPGHSISRRNVVLEQMEKYGYLSQSESDSLKSLTLELDYANLESEGPANYFLVQIRQEAESILEELNEDRETPLDLKKDGLIIETSLSLELQTYAMNAMKAHLSKMQERLNKQYSSGQSKKSLSVLVDREIEKNKLQSRAGEIRPREIFTWDGFQNDSISLRDSIAQSLLTLQAGFIAMDPNDGEIKAWIGGNDYRTQPYDQVFAQRQTASAFKPILYASALEQGAMPCQYLDNDPIVLTDFEGWQPQNYDHSVGGKYSVAGALAKSMNIPTVNLFFRQDFDELAGIWRALGYSQELEYEPAVALGTTSASLFEMSRAYAVFANGGMAVEPTMIRRIRTSDGKVLYQDRKLDAPRRVLDSSTSELLNAMLQKAMVEGTGRSMSGSYGVQLSLAGKTGTSQDYADSWFLAYSPKLVLATRVGAQYPSIHFSSGSNGSGSALALPIVARTLQGVQRSGGLKKRFFPPFPELSEYNAYVMACDDYIDDSEIEKMFERVFSSDMTTFEKASKKAQRKARKKEKKGFFNRLFKRKKD